MSTSRPVNFFQSLRSIQASDHLHPRPRRRKRDAAQHLRLIHSPQTASQPRSQTQSSPDWLAHDPSTASSSFCPPSRTHTRSPTNLTARFLRHITFKHRTSLRIPLHHRSQKTSCARIASSGIHEGRGVVAGEQLGGEFEADAARGADDEIGGHDRDDKEIAVVAGWYYWCGIRCTASMEQKLGTWFVASSRSFHNGRRTVHRQ